MKVSPDQVQVLVVDPSGDRHSQLHVALKSKGFVQVMVYDDHEEAKVASLHFAGPTLVLFFLPRERGNYVNYVRFFQRGANKPIEVAIVALTNVGEGLKREFLQFGAAGFLTTDSSPQAMALVDEIMADASKFGAAHDPAASSANLFRLNPMKAPGESDAPWIPPATASGLEPRRGSTTPPRGTEVRPGDPPSVGGGLPPRRGGPEDTGGKMFVAPRGAAAAPDDASQRARRAPADTRPPWSADAPSNPSGTATSTPPPPTGAGSGVAPSPRYQAAAVADSSAGMTSSAGSTSSRVASPSAAPPPPLYAPAGAGVPMRRPGPSRLVLGGAIGGVVVVLGIIGAVVMGRGGDEGDAPPAATRVADARTTPSATPRSGASSEPIAFPSSGGAPAGGPRSEPLPIGGSRPVASSAVVPTPAARSEPIGGMPTATPDPFRSSSTPFDSTRATPVATPIPTPRPRPAADFDPFANVAAPPPAAAAPVARVAGVESMLEARRRVRTSGFSASSMATVEGVVTFGDGGFVPGRNQFNFQDETGGLAVDDANRVAGSIPRAGDRVRLTGRLEEYRGMLQMVPVQPIVSLGTAPLPAPLSVTPQQFHDDIEGMLVRVDNLSVVTSSFPPTPSNMNLVFRTPGGDLVNVFIDQDTGIMGTTPLTPISVQGILYTFNNGWVIYPRGMHDIILGR